MGVAARQHQYRDRVRGHALTFPTNGTLIPPLAGGGGGGGYLLGDGMYDSNPRQDLALSAGRQLVARRAHPDAGLGQSRHSPRRLRSIAPVEGGSPFGAAPAHARDLIERKFGNLTGYCGGGLQTLPA